MSDKIQAVQQPPRAILWPTGENAVMTQAERDSIDRVVLRIQQDYIAAIAAALQTQRDCTAGEQNYFVAATSGGAVTTALRVRNGYVVPPAYTPAATRTDTPFEYPANASGRIPKLLP